MVLSHLRKRQGCQDPKATPRPAETLPSLLSKKAGVQPTGMVIETCAPLCHWRANGKGKLRDLPNAIPGAAEVSGTPIDARVTEPAAISSTLTDRDLLKRREDSRSEVTFDLALKL